MDRLSNAAAPGTIVNATSAGAIAASGRTKSTQPVVMVARGMPNALLVAASCVNTRPPARLIA